MNNLGEQGDGTFKVEKASKPQLHATSLNMKCMEAFRRRYVENEIIPPGIAAIVGTATDKSVTKNLGHKIETKTLLSLEEVADTARDGLNQAWEGGVRLDPEDAAKGIKVAKGDAVDKAVRLSILHAKAKAPVLQPTAVQRKWMLELNGYPFDLVGTMDIQEGAESIRDTKTSGKTPQEDVAQRSIQLATYSMAAWKIDGAAPKKTYLDYLIDNKTPVAKTFEAEKTVDDYQKVLNRVEVFASALEKGVFVPVEPEHWCCSARFCGYWDSCRYAFKPKQFAA